jgi:hypothetical protein
MLRISNSAAMDSPVASLPLIAPLPGFICGTLPVPTAAEVHSKELVTVQASSMKVISDRSGGIFENWQLLANIRACSSMTTC